MNEVKIFLAFVAGAGIGSAVTYKLVKDKFQKKANEDIEAIRELYSEKKPDEKIEENIPQSTEAEKAKNKPDIMEYASKLKESGYVDYSRSVVAEEETMSKDISYISIDEFGEDELYDTIILTYYADGVLTDETDEPIDDFMDIVGNFTTHFGEYDDDICYVRNDRRKAYYEIDRDYSNFGE